MPMSLVDHLPHPILGGLDQPGDHRHLLPADDKMIRARRKADTLALPLPSPITSRLNFRPSSSERRCTFTR